MPITLGPNIASLGAQRKLNDATSSLSKSFERLSSGMRINRASDDAAGLAIATQLNAKSRVYTQAVRNVNDGVSAAQVAEGALSALQDLSQRQLELATEAANGTYSLQQRRALNSEANKLVDEFNRIVSNTTFNGLSLFDPNLGSIIVQAGYGSAESLSVSVGDQLTRNIGDGTFGAGTSLALTAYSLDPVDLRATVADFNGDGKLDFVQNTDGFLELYTGKGDGTFALSRTLSPSSVAQSVSTGDVDGDGKVDLIVGNDNGRIDVFLGNGNGTFKAKKSSTTSGIPDSIFVADINGDGINDLVSANHASRITTFIGNGDGTFKAANTITVTGSNFSITVADVNGDGNLDIASANFNTSVFILLGNGNGTFKIGNSLVSADSTRSVVSGDFNGDGVIDIVSGSYNETSIFIGNGNGTFKAGRTYTVGSTGTVNAMAAGDLNGDGYLDFTTADSTGVVSTFIGNGDGSFSAPRSFSAGEDNRSVTIGDFDGDGRSDMLTTETYNVYETVPTVGTGYYNHGLSHIFLANGAQTTNAAHLNINTQQGARDALSIINTNLARVQNQLGAIGAASSRLQSALNTIQTKSVNFQAAAGRIQNADIADESANLVRTQILQQAASSVLANANLEPKLALKLIRGD